MPKTTKAAGIELSVLDTFMVFGKPIGDCTADEVRRWAAMRAADARRADSEIAAVKSLMPGLRGN
jgi:hypothetical protein